MTPQEILDGEGIYYLYKGRDLLVRCLSPDHEDSNPSMRVDKVTGVFNCLSCGFKGSLYTKYKIARDIQFELLSKVKGKLRDIVISTEGRSIPEGSIEYNRASFKGIPAKTLKEYGAFTNDTVFPDRIVFPIKDAVGRIIAFSARSLYSDLPPKYIVSPAEVDIPFFPAIITPEYNSMFIVEGIFDYINLKYLGCDNAVCIFGTVKLTERNVVEKLAPYRLQGVQKINIMMDGDDAGRKAAKKIKYLIDDKTEFVTNIVYLEDGQDPGGLTPEQVAKYKSTLYSS